VHGRAERQHADLRVVSGAAGMCFPSPVWVLESWLLTGFCVVQKACQAAAKQF
jgi:hypothetical protein